MNRSQWILLLSVVTGIFWYIGTTVNVYSNVLLGGIFEFFWLFMIAAVFVLPVVSIIFWAKEKFRFRSLYPLAIIINTAVLVFLFVFHKN